MKTSSKTNLREAMNPEKQNEDPSHSQHKVMCGKSLLTASLHPDTCTMQPSKMQLTHTESCPKPAARVMAL